MEGELDNELIVLRDAVMNDGGKIPAVNARELHGYLEVKTRFNDWICRRIEDGGFVEGEDYSFLSKSSADCLVSLDMAKHLCMLERNEKGKQARQYFIECEKRFHAAIMKPMTVEEMIIHQAKSVMEVKARLETQEAIAAKHEHTLLEVNNRINNLDGIDINGTPRRQLNYLVRKYAQNRGIEYRSAWDEFVRRFNLTFGANLRLAIEYYEKKIKRQCTIPEYLETSMRIEDGVRVADKMVHQGA